MKRMISVVSALWQRNRWLTASFIIMLAFAIFFTVRSAVFFIYWHNHFEEPIEGWMTIRYVSNSYRVPPNVIHDAIGLPKEGPDRRMLFEIAKSRDETLDTLTAQIMAGISTFRTEIEAGNSKGAPPAPPDTPAPAPN